ncbi:hypothetical protein ACXHXM_04050|nr:hypothetical protein [Rhizobium altiplani]
MNRAFMVAAVAALFNLTTLAPSPAAPVSSKAKQSIPKVVSKQNAEATAPTTNLFLTPRMMGSQAANESSL